MLQLSDTFVCYLKVCASFDTSDFLRFNPKYAKRSKVDKEQRVFNDEWRLKYFFTEINHVAHWPIYYESVAVCKQYNIKQHYQRKHSSTSDSSSKNSWDAGEHLKQTLSRIFFFLLLLISSNRIFGRWAADAGNATPTFCFSVPTTSKLTTLTVESLWTAPTETAKHHILVIDEAS